MRKFVLFLLAALPAAFLLSGCKTVRAEGPALKIPPAKPHLEQAKHSLKNKKDAAAALPPVLGGLVSSDSWVIYKDKQQEEFKGNVSYDNGVYAFRSLQPWRLSRAISPLSFRRSPLPRRVQRAFSRSEPVPFFSAFPRRSAYPQPPLEA